MTVGCEGEKKRICYNAGGAYISRYISERMISIIGGLLFILFGAATLAGLF